MHVELEYECDHEGFILRLQETITKKEQAISSLHDRIQNQIAVKEREILNANDKLAVAATELNSLKKKARMTETDRILELEQKIRTTVESNKDLEKEIKFLKKQQRSQGKELISNND